MCRAQDVLRVVGVSARDDHAPRFVCLEQSDEVAADLAVTADDENLAGHGSSRHDTWSGPGLESPSTTSVLKLVPATHRAMHC